MTFQEGEIDWELGHSSAAGIMSRGLSLKTTRDLCVAFSLFSSFMFPLRMNNPSSQSCVPSFQTLTFFLTQFQSSLSILRCPCSISSGSSLPPKVINLFLSQESVSGLQETFFLLDHQLCRATENRTVSATTNCRYNQPHSSYSVWKTKWENALNRLKK